MKSVTHQDLLDLVNKLKGLDVESRANSEQAHKDGNETMSSILLGHAQAYGTAAVLVETLEVKAWVEMSVARTFAEGAA
jgi:hypothetical protein